ncbi:MAG TPA: hypothetical protein HA299_07065 [Methermicoccus shengliensis]|uniref:SLC41A/MgtE integral membrane domain-containing protein n=2 Tax=Methermicoccus shengliensis TaxID=660064 RepID=A0A832RXR1_9EURY|nr:hypothetical protein [Methermicoccus shengliensis]
MVYMGEEYTVRGWRSAHNEVASMMRQSLFALMVCAIGDLVAGLSLGVFSSYLELIPGLLVLVPAAIDMRGNVYASLGSRLGTYLHTGELSPELKERTILNQLVLASFSQTIALSVLLALLAKAITLAIGIPSVGVAMLMMISVLGGVLAALVMLTSTVLIATRSVLRGWDPDNITTPLITAIGDLVTIPMLLLAAYVVLRLQSVLDALAVLVLAVCAVGLATSMRRRHPISRSIIVQSIPILTVCALLSTFAGVFLEHKLEALLMYTSLFLLIPSLNEEAGNLGSILAARLSSSHRMGIIRIHGAPDAQVLLSSLALILLGMVMFPMLGVLVHIISPVFGLTTPGLVQLVVLSTVVGMVVALLSNVVAYYLTFLSIRYRVDPDNAVIPLLTSTMDFITTGVLMFFVSHFVG